MKKWQNLLYKQCPECETHFEAIKIKGRLYYYCRMCGFQISVTKIAEIFADETHILRKFITKEQEEALRIILKNI